MMSASRILAIMIALTGLTISSANGPQAPIVDPATQDVAQLAATVETNPDDIRGHLNLMIGLLNDGRNREALQVAETALVIWPGEAALHANRAVAYARMGRSEAAQQAVRSALEGQQTDGAGLSNAQQAELHARQAWVLAADGALDDAARHLREANDLAGGRYTSDVMRFLASTPSDQGLADLLRLPPAGNPDARTLALARIYRALGRTSDAERTLAGSNSETEALQDARRALQGKPPTPGGGPANYAFLLRLHDQLAQQRWQDVLGGTDRLQGTAYNQDAKLLAGWAHLGAGQLRDAARVFEALIAQIPLDDPKRPAAVAGRLEALHRQGAHDAVLEVAAAHQVPTAALDLKTAVAVAQANTGRTAAADVTLQEVLKQDPNYAPALELQSQLAVGSDF